MIRQMTCGVALILLAGCTSSGGAPEPDPTAWSKALMKTTCREWNDVMTPLQRAAVSHDLIEALRAKDQSDDFARRFERNVSKACEPGLDTVGDIAAAIATLDSQDFD